MFHSARNSRRGAKITSKKNYRKTQILNFGISFGVCGDIGRMEIECRRGYYGVLGVNLGSSDDEIRRAYRKLAMQWHPDKWSRTPSLLGQAKEKFQQIQEAYSILSDRTKRTLYDAGLYDEEQEEEDVEGFADFLQEMVAVVNDVRKENKTYSMEELQSMFWDMAQGYDIPMYDSKCFRAANSCQVNMAG